MSDNLNSVRSDCHNNFAPRDQSNIQQAVNDCLDSFKDSVRNRVGNSNINCQTPKELDFGNIWKHCPGAQPPTERPACPPPTDHRPPVERPPVCHPPVDHRPPVDRPPVCHPPVDHRPPVERPPVTPQPPVDRPPVERPPVTPQPPVDRPPVERPPVTPQPPVDRPPVERPPVERPPLPTSNNFSIRDGKIYDPKGQEFQAKGVDVDELDIALQDIDKITKDWDFNTIRLSPYNAKDGVPTYDHAKLQKVVDEYTKRGVVVELTDGLRGRWGDVLTGKELADHAEYYKQLATQFKNNPYVWLATPNEAGKDAAGNGKNAEDKAWMNEQLTIDRTIRATGNKNIIVQGDDNWGQGASGGGASEIIKHADEFKQFGNLIAGMHIYNDHANASQQVSNAIDALKDKGFAVLADEVGTFNFKDTSAGLDTALKDVDEGDIGMLAFRWYENKTNNLTTEGRGKGQLTAFGRKIWNMTHEE